VTFLRLIAPIVGRGLRASLARERALAGRDDDPTAAGILVLDASGELRFSTPAGEGWAARLRDAGRDQHPTLPTAVLAAVAGLRAGSQSGAAVLASVPGGLVRVEASTDGADGAAVVLTAVRPPSPPDVPLAWPLTSGEREVVGLLLHGLSNAQIAARLHRSENTVQTHLRHAYAKLGVSSRTRLLARLFQETYWADGRVGELEEVG
jgi:DNA-binding CsgD family transcriptional regulator